MKKAVSKKEKRITLKKARIANTFLSRFLGLMGRKKMPKGEILVFPKCNSVHTFFMRFAIDVVMVDQQGRVVEVVGAMKPWRLLMPRLKARHTIELAAGRADELGIEKGVSIQCEGAWS